MVNFELSDSADEASDTLEQLHFMLDALVMKHTLTCISTQSINSLVLLFPDRDFLVISAGASGMQRHIHASERGCCTPGNPLHELGRLWPELFSTWPRTSRVDLAAVVP